MASSPPARRSARPDRAELEALIGAIDGIVLALDPATYAVRYVGRRALGLLGFRETDWLSDPRFFLDRLDAAERPSVEALLRAVAGGGKRDVVHRFATAHGKPHWYQTYARPLRDAAGNVVEIALLMFDITERHVAELAPDKGGQHLRLILEQLPAIVWTTDRELRFTSGSAGTRILDALELGPHTMRGISIADYLQTDDPTHPSLVQHRRALRGETGSYELERHGRSYSVRIEPFRDAAGGIIGTIAVALDVTEQRRIERELRRQSARLELLAAASAEFAHASLDPSVLVEAVARRISEALGDLCVIRLVADDDRLELAAIHHHDPARIARARKIFSEFREPILLGTERPRDGVPIFLPKLGADITDRLAPALRERIGAFHSAIGAPMQVGDHTLGVITLLRDDTPEPYSSEDASLVRDIGERAAQAIENARLYASAQEAVRLRDEFLSVASHELRTPVTTLLLRIQRALRAPATCDAATLAALERTALRLSMLLDELVDVSRLRLGRLELHREDSTLADIAREVVERTREEAARFGSTIELHSDGDTSGAFDRPRLEQVLGEMLSNAMKFGAGRPIEVEVRGVDGTVRFAVRDHGVGVPPEDRQRIFERFERAASSRHFGGLGLGLYVARHVVEAHGGSIRVEAPEGAGARFVVTLPR